MRTTLEIGAHVPALLIGGDLDGVFVQVRLGLDGLPRFLVFPKLIADAPSWDDPFEAQCAAFTEDRYRLYDDVPCKYLHESEWGGGDDDDENERTPTPSPGLLTC